MEKITRANNFELKLDKLDDSQYKVVTSKSDNILVRAPAGSGKALKNGTKILTINGWKNIEDLSLEDKVAAEDGKFYNVTGIYPQGKKQIYKVIFSDGNIIECSPDHLWTYQTKNQRDEHRNNFKYSKTQTLEYIYNNVKLKNNNGSWNIYIPIIQPISFEKQKLPLDPYLLGVLLGDGCMSQNKIVFTCAESDLLVKVENILKQYECKLTYLSKYDYTIQGPQKYGYNNMQNYIGASIRELGLSHSNSHNKFIPSIYLFSDEEDRLKLLQGLMDTDGYCSASEYDIILASKQLILDIQFLCESLGFTAIYSEKEPICNGKQCGTVYRLNIKTSEKYPKIHTTINKDNRWKEGQSSSRRTIRQIIPTDNYEEMTCISVDSPNHLFVTEHFIVTHNTFSILSAVSAYRYENINDRICAITYTRAARAEMESRLQQMGIYDVDVTTIHVWARTLLNDFAIKYGFKIKILQEGQIKAILQDLVSEYILHSKIKNINIDILYSFISGNKNMDIKDNYKRTLVALESRYIKYKRDNLLYDFTDYPLYLYNVLNTYDEEINNIDALFIDEYQDVDEVQFDLFQKVNAKKKFFVGDPWQCQPTGTKVWIRSKDGGLQKNIEEVEVGDPIIYYDQSQGYVSGNKLPHNAILKKVLEVQKHTYQNADLITIKTENGLQSSYTNNHRTFVRFNRYMNENPYIVYLMCNSDYRFRIGTIPLYYTGNTSKTVNSWRDKMHQEGCTKIWILKVFDNNHDARVEEAKLSYLYNIPQTCWQVNKVNWTKEDIDYIYEELDTFTSAKRCLERYHLDINYPLLDDEVNWMKRNHYTSNASSEIYAINLIPHYMSVIAYGSDTNHKNLHGEEIISVEKTYCKDPIDVYALKVEGETYVADGIVTHNSIFAFRGADGEVFDKTEDFEEFKLMCNYRSYQEIIDYATTVYLNHREKALMEEDCYISEVMWKRPSSINCARGNGGTVTVVNPYGRNIKMENNIDHKINLIEEFKEFMSNRPMILCRTNKQVKYINDAGYYEASTIHQAKGLEYKNVIVIDTTITGIEDLNIAYVALTRAEDNLFVVNWQQFELLFNMYIR